jgi:hypothetical protein
MPYKDPKDRDHQKEYKDFLAKGGRAKQTERQRARRAWDKEHGKESREGKALDHVKPIKDGGKSTGGNVRLKSFSANSARNFKSAASGAKSGK